MAELDKTISVIESWLKQPVLTPPPINELYDALELLKEQELPTELKQKMWNAFYAEEDEYEKKFVGKEEHLNWFTVYRPWLQKGFDIAINAIADWEGR